MKNICSIILLLLFGGQLLFSVIGKNNYPILTSNSKKTINLMKYMFLELLSVPPPFTSPLISADQEAVHDASSHLGIKTYMELMHIHFYTHDKKSE
jgi:hypothetical protein